MCIRDRFIGSEIFLGKRGVNALGDVHHVVEIGVGLIEFNRGEFGVVLGVHALVAEDAADFINPVHAADDQALQRQFSRNTHIQMCIRDRICVISWQSTCPTASSVRISFLSDMPPALRFRYFIISACANSNPLSDIVGFSVGLIGYS